MAKKKGREVSEEIIKMLDIENGKPFSKHFINFYIKGNGFDFDAFETQEEFEDFKRELDEFMEKNKD